MGTNVACEGMTLTIVEAFHGFTPTTVFGTIVVAPASVINACQGNGVYLDQTLVTVTAITATGATIPDPGPKTGNLNATISKVKEQGTLLLVDGDKTDEITATPSIAPSGTPFNVRFKVQITLPGQTKVKAV